MKFTIHNSQFTIIEHFSFANLAVTTMVNGKWKSVNDVTGRSF